MPSSSRTTEHLRRRRRKAVRLDLRAVSSTRRERLSAPPPLGARRPRLNLAQALEAAYRGRSPAALVDAPLTALSGVSEADARRLAELLGVRTIGELAELKIVRYARAIADAK